MPYALADFAQRCNAVVAGDKWPWYADYLPELLNVFPEAKLVYNVRDPRGLWNSAERFKDRRRGDELLDRMLENDGRVMPFVELADSLTVRYEDLVCRPEKTSRRLYEFLGCDFSRTYLNYARGADPYPKRWDWVPEAGRQFNPRHTTKWKEQMSQRQIEHVIGRAGWFMEKYEYER
jgi:hypothetical protein